MHGPLPTCKEGGRKTRERWPESPPGVRPISRSNRLFVRLTTRICNARQLQRVVLLTEGFQEWGGACSERQIGRQLSTTPAIGVQRVGQLTVTAKARAV